MPSLRVCQISAEASPFAKTGGLADVVAALTRHLARAGHDVRLVMPLYGRMRGLQWSDGPRGIEIRLGARSYGVDIRTTTLPGTDVTVRAVDCPDLYGGEALYHGDQEDVFRFAVLTRAALECCQREGFAPHVVHAHDWHAALAPLYLATTYAWDRLFEDTRTVLTLHNVAFQGRVGADLVEPLGLGNERGLLHQDHLREGYVSFLETGVLYADALTAVSGTYARQIQEPELGQGLDGLLRARGDHLFGIPNGVDDDWDPATDPHLPANFDADDLSGKRECKRALLERFGLSADDLDAPLLGCVSRLTPQKGFDLVPDVLPALLQREDLRFVMLGSGEERYERYFHWLAGEAFPDKAGFRRGYDEPLAHLIEAGSDLFLMPSRFEPCGLNQMYSQRYGTIPVVRRTGGLADTVEPADGHGNGAGVVFDEFSGDALLSALEFALRLVRDPEERRRVQRNGMTRDFSWEGRAAQYVDLYRRLPEL